MGDGNSINRRTTSQTANLEQELNDNKESGSIKEFLDKRIAIMTVANCYLWVTLCVIYYGISLSSTSLAGNPFHNNGKLFDDPYNTDLFFSTFWQCRINSSYNSRCLCEQNFTSEVCLLVDDRLGTVAYSTKRNVSSISCRRKSVDGGNVSSWVMSLISIQYVVLVLNNFAKLTCCLVWTVAFVYCGEIYPTRWRSTGSGLASGAARFGSMVAPQLAFRKGLDFKQTLIS